MTLIACLISVDLNGHKFPPSTNNPRQIHGWLRSSRQLKAVAKCCQSVWSHRKSPKILMLHHSFEKHQVGTNSILMIPILTIMRHRFWMQGQVTSSQKNVVTGLMTNSSICSRCSESFRIHGWLNSCKPRTDQRGSCSIQRCLVLHRVRCQEKARFLMAALHCDQFRGRPSFWWRPFFLRSYLWRKLMCFAEVLHHLDKKNLIWKQVHHWIILVAVDIL